MDFLSGSTWWQFLIIGIISSLVSRFDGYIARTGGLRTKVIGTFATIVSVVLTFVFHGWRGGVAMIVALSLCTVIADRILSLIRHKPTQKARTLNSSHLPRQPKDHSDLDKMPASSATLPGPNPAQAQVPAPATPHTAKPAVPDMPTPTAPPQTFQPATSRVSMPIESAGPSSAASKDRPAATNDQAAQRLARLLVSEIKLYNEKKVTDGRKDSNLYDVLRETIEQTRSHYIARIGSALESMPDYFHNELVRILCEGDPAKLGANYSQVTSRTR